VKTSSEKATYSGSKEEDETFGLLSPNWRLIYGKLFYITESMSLVNTPRFHVP
jgi:hypothetical protein